MMPEKLVIGKGVMCATFVTLPIVVGGYVKYIVVGLNLRDFIL